MGFAALVLLATVFTILLGQRSSWAQDFSNSGHFGFPVLTSIPRSKWLPFQLLQNPYYGQQSLPVTNAKYHYGHSILPVINNNRYNGQSNNPVLDSNQYHGQQRYPFIDSNQYYGQQSFPFIGNYPYPGQQNFPVMESNQYNGQQISVIDSHRHHAQTNLPSMEDLRVTEESSDDDDDDDSDVVEIPPSINKQLQPKWWWTAASAALTPQTRGYTYSNGLGWYKVHAKYVTFDQAKAVCEGELARLVIFNTQAEVDLTVKLMKAANVDRGWIGLTDVITEATFLTIFNDPLSTTFPSWATLQPTASNTEADDCVYMDAAAPGMTVGNCNSKPSATVCEI